MLILFSQHRNRKAAHNNQVGLSQRQRTNICSRRDYRETDGVSQILMKKFSGACLLYPLVSSR